MPKNTKAPAPTAPLLPVRAWLAQHAELPVESAAGFIRHVAQDAWATAEEWEHRWAAWLQHHA